VASLAEAGGRVLAGRYRLGEPLGQGGHATVYAAVDEHLQRDVAVKVWDRPCEDPAREARIAARVQHPGVVVVHDAHPGGDLSYLVMERISGCSLSEALRDGPLPESRCVHLVVQLCRTLSLVHADGVVHGDVKPGNVLLGPGDRVTLTDFGVASPTRTRNRSEARGTPPYLSPEQVRGRPVTPATDVYATGLLLLECLTGTRAFTGSPEAAAVARLHGGPLVPSWVARDLAALVREMTALDPDDRPSAADVARRLEERTPETRTVLVPVQEGPPTEPVRTAQEGRPWWLLVGAVLVGVVALLAMTGPDRALPKPAPEAATTQAPVAGATPPAVRPAPRATPAGAQRAQAVAPAAPAPVAVVHGKKHGHGLKGKKG
jgi:serine/threonine protein kinase